MNRVLALLMASAICMSLSGCGIKGNLELPEEIEGKAYEK